jgi:xanthine dehydrogenase YagS FAD-binding subunit
MNPFSYQRATGIDAAVHSGAMQGAKFLGGGTNLVDLMRYDVEHPQTLIDVNHAGMDTIAPTGDGGLRIGAGVKNTAMANDRSMLAKYPLVSQAILNGASAQLRNMATTGGNLMQRTRCYYFMDTAFPACNKRMPGSGCAALHGFNRIHAVLGQTDDGAKSPHTCIATNPSDMNVALYALDAAVEVTGPKGKRTIPVREFHRLPGNDPAMDTVLRPDELIVAVTLPAAAAKFASNSYYLKVRDRQSYAFALVSVAAGVEMQGSTIKSATLALGGVAMKPWYSGEAVKALTGKPATEQTFKAAADAAMHGAHGYKDNAFKIELAKLSIVRALTIASQAAANKGVA